MDWPRGAKTFIEEARVARLATADARAAPHVIPICFALVDDRLYTVVDGKPKRTDKPLKRLLNLTRNPQVAVVIDHYDEDWSKLEYVLIRGRAGLVKEGGLFLKVRAALRRRYEPYRTMGLSFENSPMIEIEPLEVHHWRSS